MNCRSSKLVYQIIEESNSDYFCLYFDFSLNTVGEINRHVNNLCRWPLYTRMVIYIILIDWRYPNCFCSNLIHNWAPQIFLYSSLEHGETNNFVYSNKIFNHSSIEFELKINICYKCHSIIINVKFNHFHSQKYNFCTHIVLRIT